MKCPHCTVNIHESWQTNQIVVTNFYSSYTVDTMKCPACTEQILRLVDGHGEYRFIVPATSSRGTVSQDVPTDIADDYNEAAIVLPHSPKASAALSRRCLQAVLRQAGYNQRDLAQQIDAVLNEQDTRKALPSSVHMTLDTIRNFGNFSAHPINDQTTLQIIDVEEHEAEFCLDILDSVFDHYYVRPAEAKRKKAALDQKLMSAGKPASK